MKSYYLLCFWSLGYVRFHRRSNSAFGSWHSGFFKK